VTMSLISTEDEPAETASGAPATPKE
jgi:hypothetical protein